MKYIKAKDLAKELLKNPNDIIVVTSDNFEMRNAKIPLNYVDLTRGKANIVKQQFTDAFDGCRYNANVVRMKSDGELDVVLL